MLKTKHISIKTKLLILMISSISFALVTYGYFVLTDFKKDKLAYVLDTNADYSKSVAQQFESEVESHLSQMNSYFEGFNDKENKFAASALLSISKNLNIDAIYAITEMHQSDEIFSEELYKKRNVEKSLSHFIEKVKLKLANSVNNRKFFVFKLPEYGGWGAVISVTNSENKKMRFVFCLSGAKFRTYFDEPQKYDTYLVDEIGNILFSSRIKNYDSENKFSDNGLKQKISDKTQLQSVFKEKFSDEKTWFVSIVTTKIAGFKIVSLVPETAAMQTIYLVIFKSIFFLLFLVGASIFISFFASQKLTRSLLDLSNATQNIANGDFDVKLSVKSNDEVGLLTNRFLVMAQEIKRLILEVITKTRMEEELKTAQLVQSSLFPALNYSFENFHISGLSVPATECSGDWWFYQRVNNKTFFCIGDATGHGVPAALVTAAARSAISILDELPNLSLGELVKIFNRIVYNVTLGKLNMTFFIGMFDQTTGQLDYVNASHLLPFVLPDKVRIDQKDVEFLDASSNPPLGVSAEQDFKIATRQLGLNERILLYTDGITEMNNHNNKMLGEKSFLKIFLKSSQNETDLQEIVKKIQSEISEFQGEKSLEDDVTFFVVQRT